MTLASSLTDATNALRRRIVPELTYSQVTFEQHLLRRGAQAQRWLDVGCGHHLLLPWHAEEEAAFVQRLPQVIGLDFDMASLLKHRSFRQVVRGDVRSLPFADASFDLVTANMVVEHLDDPARQFREIARVLAPGGIFLFHTPNIYGYPAFVAQLLPDRFKTWLSGILEGRPADDVFKTHYRANRRSDIEALAQAAGLQVEDFLHTASVPVFTRFPPLALFELLYLRLLLRQERLAFLRQTLIVALRRPAHPS